MGPSKEASQVSPTIPAAVLWFTIWRHMMVKQKGHKAGMAAARAAKDNQFKAFQLELGLLSDKDG
jgi:hypothetical protein